MSIVQIRHITRALENEFRPFVDMSDYVGKPKQMEEDAFYSRAQAAFSLVITAKATPAVAGSCVVDSFDDNGIDAIYFDPDEKMLFLVQSKWHKTGNGSIDSAEVMKFVQGVRNLLEADFSRFNEKIRRQETSILAALDDPSVRFRLVLVHTGVQALSTHAQRPLNDLLNDVNDASNMLSTVTFNQTDLHRAVVAEAEGDSIKLEVMLSEWGQCKQPYASYYGQVEAADIGLWWKEYQQSLFAKNLRKFTGSTEVNEAIKDTLRKGPERFWYFNNGITILCTKLRKKPMGGSRRTSGDFVCEGVSIVNGAQTVGCIGAIAASDPESLANARVNVRLISVANCPDDFGTELTRAANTQNKIERRDFAALDPEQERLRRDLSLDLGKTYFYKSGDSPGNATEGCTIEEATVALACAIPDVSLAVQAKREVGKLWEDVAKAPYKLLFNGSLSALRMWRLVVVIREVEQALKREQENRQGRDRMITVHGNRFILHLVYCLLDLSRFDDPAFDVASIIASVPTLTQRCSDIVIKQTQAIFPTAYTNSLFKNATKCRQLSAKCLAKLKAKTAKVRGAK
jgi:AIPR protein